VITEADTCRKYVLPKHNAPSCATMRVLWEGMRERDGHRSDRDQPKIMIGKPKDFRTEVLPDPVTAGLRVRGLGVNGSEAISA